MNVKRRRLRAALTRCTGTGASRRSTRRAFLIAAGAIVAMPLLVQAQQRAEMPWVALLWLGSSAPSPLLEAFREGLRDHGYIDGQNIHIEDRSSVDRYERLPKVAEELIRLKVNVIVTFGATATQAASRATTTIPIVMVAGIDPVEMGIAATLSRPGGNVTGLTMLNQELVAKRLELLKEAIPGLRRVAVLLNPSSRGEVDSLSRAKMAAKSLNLQVQAQEVRIPSDFEAAFTAIARGGAGALCPVPSTMLNAYRHKVVRLAAKHRLPALFPESSFVEMGGLFSYGASITDTFRRAASYVDKILKGAKPGDLPIEQPTKFELVINANTAKTLGIKFPQSILLHADKVRE